MSPSQRAPRRRVSRVRLVALSAVVVLSAALPLTAASAGSPDGLVSALSSPTVESTDGRPSGSPPAGRSKSQTSQLPGTAGVSGGEGQRDAQHGTSGSGGPSAGQAVGGSADALSSPDETKRSPDGATSERDGSENGQLRAGPEAGNGTDVEQAQGGPTSVCGPQLSTGERVMAQTCVLEEEDQTWGRTYYRNSTGGRLKAVLTLMRPDGRTLQVHCVLPASANSGTCETPRERTIHPLEGEQPYTGLAEIASADGERMLLRSGSNSPE